MKRFKRLEDENARLKKIVADLTLDREIVSVETPLVRENTRTDLIRRKITSLSMLSSFWCAVLHGRNQLFETMKRGGADRLRGVVMPQGSDVAHHPAIGLGRGR